MNDILHLGGHRAVRDPNTQSSLGGLQSSGARQARIARGWTQRQLAEALGMAEQQIQRYEASDCRSTSLASLRDIAHTLGVTVAQHAALKPAAV